MSASQSGCETNLPGGGKRSSAPPPTMSRKISRPDPQTSTGSVDNLGPELNGEEDPPLGSGEESPDFRDGWVFSGQCLPSYLPGATNTKMRLEAAIQKLRQNKQEGDTNPKVWHSWDDDCLYGKDKPYEKDFGKTYGDIYGDPKSV